MDGRKGRREETMREERITAMLEEWTFLPTLTMARERFCYQLSKGRRREEAITTFVPLLAIISPRFVNDTLNCFRQLLSIRSFMIHGYSQSKFFCFLGVGKLVRK